MDITEENIYYLISRLLDEFDAIEKSYTKRLLEDGYGVTASQLEILRAVGENPKISLSELAILTRLHITTVEGYANRLNRKGFLVKKKDAGDSRRVIVSLTNDGEQIMKAVPLGCRTKLFEELGRLPISEKEEVYRALKKIVFMMR
ncbi:MAG: MarR family transcriptional regulator [Deltaproteobacteria bacterium]|nr:MarR family transcriptional regulator [Candidatus Zymogenaceae bacterium]